MIDMEITRLIAAAVAAVLLGYACYVAAYVKHKNEIRTVDNKDRLLAKENNVEYEPGLIREMRLEKTKTWYFGYRLALVGLIVVSTAVGWAVGWAVGQDYVLTWVEDAALAAAGAVIGGFVLDKYIIHPIADGSFFEKVEDPIVQRFLQDGVPVVEAKVKEKKGLFKKKKVGMEEVAPAVSAAPAEAPEVRPEVQKTLEDVNVVDITHLSFDEKVKLIEALRRSL